MTAFWLKIIAMVTMLIDHTGHYLLNNDPWFRLIGRIAFVLYAFMAAEGLKRTHNKKRYLLQLFIFTLVSIFPYHLMTRGLGGTWDNNNVGFTLFLGTLMLYLWENMKKVSSNNLIKILSALVLGGLGIYLSKLLNSDYAINGIMLIYLFYFFNHSSKWKPLNLILIIVTFFFMSLFKVYESLDLIQIFHAMFQGIGWVYFGIFLPLIPLMFYNGEKGYSSKWFKSFYWWFYPIHQLLIWALTYFMI